ncbi:MAG: hypothetical protein ACR652_07520 [Methylocystis sp.]
MNKFFAMSLGALIGTAMFAVIGVGLAHAQMNTNDGYGVVVLDNVRAR